MFSGILLRVKIRGILSVVAIVLFGALHAAPHAWSPQLAEPRPVVVLDPAHGGADTGARGSSGVIEKDVVLAYARAIRSELERQGWRVVLTRRADEGLSFDDRAAAANAQRSAVFVSLHVASTGTVGTARAYYFSGLLRDPSLLPGPKSTTPSAPRPVTTLVPWERAQEPHLPASRRLAEALQAELALRLLGSAPSPGGAAIHQLRFVAAPAVAIEVASVSVPNTSPLEQISQALAESVARALAVFRAGAAGGRL